MAPFEVISEQRVPGDATAVQWCPTMDLVAVTTADNQKVWSRPGRELESMTSLAWRPDGKALAVGHTDGSVALLDVEDGEELFCHPPCGVAIRALTWAAREWPASESAFYDVDCMLDPHKLSLFDDVDGAAFENSSSAGSAIDYEDRTDSVLPPLPPMGEQAELTNRPDVLIGKPESTNVLAMVTSDTKISFYSLGIYGVGSGVLDPLLAKSGGIGDGTVEVALGPNLSTAMVCVLPESGELQTYPVDIPLLATQPAEVHCIAAQWAHISGLLRYLDAVTTLMKSAWESILIELDAKLAAFSESQKDAAGTDEAKLLEHEFMALLVRGIPSIDLEHFLVRELSPKLKALGSAVESSYRSIQRLAVTHFNQAIQALLFRLGDVSGLAEWTERFGSLGIDTRGLEKVTGTLGSLAHKSAELVRRIDSSRTSFKAFFAWLNKVVASLDGKSASETSSAGPIDFEQVSTFIQQNFGTAGDGEKVSVEHVGQYFEATGLRTVQEHAQPAWRTLLKRLTLDLPTGGAHAEVLTAIEGLQGGGDGTPVSESALADALQRPIGKTELDLTWLEARGLVRKHMSGFYTVPCDAVARSAHPLLFPDRPRESLTQVLTALSAEMTAIFSVPRDEGDIAVHVGDGGSTAPLADKGPGIVVQQVKRDDATATFCAAFADGSADDDDEATLIFCETRPDGSVGLSAVGFDSVRIVRIRGYCDDSVVVLVSTNAPDAGGVPGTQLIVVPTETLEFMSFPPKTDLATAVNNIAVAAVPVEDIEGYRSRALESISAGNVHVSATRQLASVFDTGGRAVQLLDLAAEDDDDDDDDDEDGEDNGEEAVAEETVGEPEADTGHVEASGVSVMEKPAEDEHDEVA